MRTLTNPQEFYNIHKNEKSLLNAATNFEMRVFIASYGFKVPRELAEIMIELRDKP